MSPKSTKTTKGSKSSQTANVAQVAPEAKGGQVAEVTDSDAPVAPESAQVSKPRAKRPKGEATLGELTAAYLRHLEDAGKSEGTIFSYRMDLKAALDHFGEDTAASTLTPTKVGNFYASDGVTKKRNGKKRSEITIAKTRRVFRLALVWAAENGMIEKAPIPADEMEHARGAAKSDAKETPKPTRVKRAKAVKTPAADLVPTAEPATATPTE